MPKFILAFFGRPDFGSPEAKDAYKNDWETWLSSLGASVIDPGLPIGPGVTMSADGSTGVFGAPALLSGITTIEATNMSAAEEIAKACPHLGTGLTIHIAPAVEVV